MQCKLNNQINELHTYICMFVYVCQKAETFFSCKM